MTAEAYAAAALLHAELHAEYEAESAAFQARAAARDGEGPPEEPAPPLRVLRLAVGDMYKLRRVERSIGCAWVAKYPDRNPARDGFGARVCVGETRGKMVLSACDEAGCVQFLEYGTASGSGRFGAGGTAGMPEREEDEADEAGGGGS